MEIRPLREDDDRSNFRCGDPDLDRYLAKYAGQNQFRHHIGATYVAVDDGCIVGFTTVAAGQIAGEELPSPMRESLPRYPLPVLRLARLAVDSQARGRGVGEQLLRYTFRLARKLSVDFGCVGIVLDAKPDAVAFYTRFGFSALESVRGNMESRPQPLALFLPLAVIAAARPR